MARTAGKGCNHPGGRHCEKQQRERRIRQMASARQECRCDGDESAPRSDDGSRDQQERVLRDDHGAKMLRPVADSAQQRQLSSPSPSRFAAAPRPVRAYRAAGPGRRAPGTSIDTCSRRDGTRPGDPALTRRRIRNRRGLLRAARRRPGGPSIKKYRNPCSSGNARTKFFSETISSL